MHFITCFPLGVPPYRAPLQGLPTGPPGSPRSKAGPWAGWRLARARASGSGFGFGFRLAFRISDGVLFDSRSGLALAWLRLDFGFWLSFTWILLGFRLDFGLISVGFGLISAGA